MNENRTLKRQRMIGTKKYVDERLLDTDISRTPHKFRKNADRGVKITNVSHRKSKLHLRKYRSYPSK
jgi:hypothetical protein